MSDLCLHPLNLYQAYDSEGIAALTDSVRSIGLIQTLSGLADAEGRVEIVSGSRRLRVLQIVAAGQEASFVGPVKPAGERVAVKA